MKLIKPSVEYIPQIDLYKHIELCARTCYKSEDRITEDSAQKFVERLVNSNHLAMLEHGTIHAKCGSEQYKEIRDGNLDSDSDFWTVAHSPYSELVYHDHCNYLTTNYRVLFDLAAQDTEFSFNDFIANFQCEPTVHHVKRYTLKFICDRGVSHELVRHRRMSFAQESQRYCNYSKDKFGGVSFIEPSWFNSKDSSSEQREAFIQICQDSEECYLKLLDSWDNKKPDRRFKTGFKGNPLTPQQARGVLPNATKTEIIMTGFEDDWVNFMDLRLRGTTGKPHPDMRYIAQLAWNEFKDKLSLEL